MTETIDFVETLVNAVEAATRAGRLFLGTYVATVLRSPYEAAGLSTRKGAYRAVIEEAIARRRVRRLYPAGSTGGDILIPFDAAPPLGYVTAPIPEAASASGTSVTSASGASVTLGLPRTPAFLKREVYRAFTGLDRPRFADTSTPPHLRLSAEKGPAGIEVVPVPIEEVKALWDKVSEEFGVEAAAQVRSQLDTLGGAWGKLEIPGDSAKTAWGAVFNRRRLGLVATRIKAWAEIHHLDLSHFALVEPPRAAPSAAVAPLAPAHEVAAAAGRAADRPAAQTEELRRRLKLAIDRMTLQQLCELRVPAEFLLD